MLIRNHSNARLMTIGESTETQANLPNRSANHTNRSANRTNRRALALSTSLAALALTLAVPQNTTDAQASTQTATLPAGCTGIRADGTTIPTGSPLQAGDTLTCTGSADAPIDSEPQGESYALTDARTADSDTRVSSTYSGTFRLDDSATSSGDDYETHRQRNAPTSFAPIPGLPILATVPPPNVTEGRAGADGDCRITTRTGRGASLSTLVSGDAITCLGTVTNPSGRLETDAAGIFIVLGDGTNGATLNNGISATATKEDNTTGDINIIGFSEAVRDMNSVSGGISVTSSGNDVNIANIGSISGVGSFSSGAITVNSGAGNITITDIGSITGIAASDFVSQGISAQATSGTIFIDVANARAAASASGSVARAIDAGTSSGEITIISSGSRSGTIINDILAEIESTTASANITIDTRDDTITGRSDTSSAILASNNGSGSITLTVANVSALRGSGEPPSSHGINARGGGSITVNVLADATVSSATSAGITIDYRSGDGTPARNAGVDNAFLVQGVTQDSEGNLTAETSGQIVSAAGSLAAILVEDVLGADVTIRNLASVTSTSANAIQIADSAGGDVTITNIDSITSTGGAGIFVNAGGGDITIDVGDVTSSASQASIQTTTSGDVDITLRGALRSGTAVSDITTGGGNDRLTVHAGASFGTWTAGGGTDTFAIAGSATFTNTLTLANVEAIEVVADGTSTPTLMVGGVAGSALAGVITLTNADMLSAGDVDVISSGTMFDFTGSATVIGADLIATPDVVTENNRWILRLTLVEGVAGANMCLLDSGVYTCLGTVADRLEATMAGITVNLGNGSMGATLQSGISANVADGGSGPITIQGAADANRDDISVASTGLRAISISTNGGDANVRNIGNISSGGRAIDINSGGGSATVQNIDLIRATGTEGSIDINTGGGGATVRNIALVHAIARSNANAIDIISGGGDVTITNIANVYAPNTNGVFVDSRDGSSGGNITIDVGTVTSMGGGSYTAVRAYGNGNADITLRGATMSGTAGGVIRTAGGDDRLTITDNGSFGSWNAGTGMDTLELAADITLNDLTLMGVENLEITGGTTTINAALDLSADSVALSMTAGGTLNFDVNGGDGTSFPTLTVASITGGALAGTITLSNADMLAESTDYYLISASSSFTIAGLTVTAPSGFTLDGMPMVDSMNRLTIRLTEVVDPSMLPCRITDRTPTPLLSTLMSGETIVCTGTNMQALETSVGDITIELGSATQGASLQGGIAATTTSAGTVTIRGEHTNSALVNVSSASGDAISVDSSGGAVEITNIGEVSSTGGEAINVASDGGTITIQGIGTITGDTTAGEYNPGIRANAVGGSGGSITIGGSGTNAIGAITANGAGIYATTDGAGDINITTAAVTAGSDGVYTRTNTGSITINTSAGTVMADYEGVLARAYGAGDINITTAAVTSTSSRGVYANTSGTGDITIDTRMGAVSTEAALAAIQADHTGTAGTITITAADVTSDTGIGIETRGDRNATITLVAGATIHGTDTSTSIQTAGGDDIININGSANGVISTGAGMDRLTITGTVGGAINSGDGNDRLTLGAATSLGGTFDGGDGDDTLELGYELATLDSTVGGLTLANVETLRLTTGTTSVSGTVALPTGMDSLSVANGATLNLAASATLTADVTNAGTLSVAGAGMAGNATISGDLVLSADGTLRVDVGAAGSNDMLIVSGAITLGGTLHVNALSGFEVGEYVLINGEAASGLTERDVSAFTITSTGADNFALSTSVNDQFDLVLTVEIGDPALLPCRITSRTSPTPRLSELQGGDTVLCTGTMSDRLSRTFDNTAPLNGDVTVNIGDGATVATLSGGVTLNAAATGARTSGNFTVQGRATNASDATIAATSGDAIDIQSGGGDITISNLGNVTTSGTNATGILARSSGGRVSVTGVGTISASGNSALNIETASATNAGTIIIGGTGNNAITSITSESSNHAAIRAVTGNGGTITIDVNDVTSAGTNSITASGGAATITVRGAVSNNITTEAGNDRLTIVSGGSVGGAINTGAGIDTLILNGNVSGAVSTGDGGDTLTISSTITGAINTEAGADVVTLTGTASDAINTGDNDDRLTLGNGGMFASFDGGMGTDTLEIARDATLNTLVGQLNEVETIQISAGTSTVSAATTFAGALTLSSNGTLTFDLNNTNTAPLLTVGGMVSLEGTIAVTNAQMLVAGGVGANITVIDGSSDTNLRMANIQGLRLAPLSDPAFILEASINDQFDLVLTVADSDPTLLPCQISSRTGDVPFLSALQSGDTITCSGEPFTRELTTTVGNITIELGSATQGASLTGGIAATTTTAGAVTIRGAHTNSALVNVSSTSGDAISVDSSGGAVEITNIGEVSSTSGRAIFVDHGAGRATINVGDVTATGTGIETMGTGVATITVASGATIHGSATSASIQTGGGADVLTIQGRANGTISTGAGMDRLTIAGTVGGAINTGAGNDTINLTGTASGAIQSGDNDDRLTLGNGGTFASFDGGMGTDTLAIARNATLNTLTLNAVENLEITSGTTTINADATFTGALTLNANGTLTFDLAGGTTAPLLTVGGAVSLQGTIAVTNADMLDTVGDSIVVIAASSAANLNMNSIRGLRLAALTDPAFILEASINDDFDLVLTVADSDPTLLPCQINRTPTPFLSALQSGDTITCSGEPYARELTTAVGNITIELGSATRGASLTGGINSTTTSAGTVTIRGAAAANTALVNVSSASGDAINVNSMGGAVSITNIGEVSSTSGRAIFVNSGAGNVTINVGDVRAAASSTAIEVQGTGVANITVASGATIHGTATSASIQTGGGADVLTIQGRANGTISTGAGMDRLTIASGATVGGAVNTGADADTLTIAGTASGDVNTGDGADMLTLNSGRTIGGAVDTGDGADVLNIMGTAQSTVSTGDGADMLTIAGTVSGAISTGAGADNISLTGTASGGISTGADNDRVTLGAGGTLTGTFDGGAGDDTLELTSDRTLDSTFAGQLNNVEEIELSAGTANVSTDFTFAGNVDVTSGATLNLAANVDLTAGVINAGTISIAGAGTIGSANITGDLTMSEDGTLAFDIDTASNDMLTVSGALSLDGSLTINLLAGFSVDNDDGETYTLIDATGLMDGDEDGLTVSGSSGYDFVLSVVNSNLMVTVTEIPFDAANCSVTDSMDMMIALPANGATITCTGSAGTLRTSDGDITVLIGNSSAAASIEGINADVSNSEGDITIRGGMGTERANVSVFSTSGDAISVDSGDGNVSIAGIGNVHSSVGRAIFIEHGDGAVTIDVDDVTSAAGMDSIQTQGNGDVAITLGGAAMAGNVAGDIVTDGGSDTLTLGNGGSFGEWDGGAGDDTLRLTQSAGMLDANLASALDNVENIAIASGATTVSGAVNFGGDVSVESGASLDLAAGAALTADVTSSGSLSVAGTETGMATITGDFNLAGGTLTLDVATEDRDNSDRITVRGSVVLGDGTIAIRQNEATATTGTVVLLSGSSAIRGSVDNLEVTGLIDNRRIQQRVAITGFGFAVSLISEVNRYPESCGIGLSENQCAVERALVPNARAGNLTNGLDTVALAIYATPTVAALGALLDEVTPHVMSGELDIFRARLTSFRRALTGGRGGGADVNSLTQVGGRGQSGSTGYNERQLLSGAWFWGSFGYDRHSNANQDNAIGYVSNGLDYSLGVSDIAAGNIHFSLAASYSDYDITTQRGTADRSDARLWQVGGSAGFVFNGTVSGRTDVVLTYSDAAHQVRMNVPSDIAAEAQLGRTSLRNFGAEWRLSIDGARGNKWPVQPFVSIAYDSTRQRGGRIGSAGAAIQVESQRYKRYSVGYGARFEYAIGNSASTAVWASISSYSHFGDTRSTLRSRFTNQGGNATLFTTTGHNIRQEARVEGGVTTSFGNGWGVSVEGHGEFADINGYGARATISKRF